MTTRRRATASPSSPRTSEPTTEEQPMNVRITLSAPGTAGRALPPLTPPDASRPDPLRTRREPGHRSRGRRDPGADRHGHRRTRFQRGR
ncbi:hypothetical protein SUDANB121_03074 [Nocardiopsis dassonvillei]|uniref:hypothetical protein n=1 Tax=Nocardiopsis dassonvillei TaxID=2014 RepID=UPI003F5441FA